MRWEYVDFLLGCDTVWTGRQIPLFRRNILFPSSRPKMDLICREEDNCPLGCYRDPDNGGSKHVWNVGQILWEPSPTSQNSSSYSPLWEPEISFSEGSDLRVHTASQATRRDIFIAVRTSDLRRWVDDHAWVDISSKGNAHYTAWLKKTKKSRRWPISQSRLDQITFWYKYPVLPPTNMFVSLHVNTTFLLKARLIIFFFLYPSAPFLEPARAAEPHGLFSELKAAGEWSWPLISVDKKCLLCFMVSARNLYLVTCSRTLQVGMWSSTECHARRRLRNHTLMSLFCLFKKISIFIFIKVWVITRLMWTELNINRYNTFQLCERIQSCDSYLHLAEL
jgi:hypothetical protein